VRSAILLPAKLRNKAKSWLKTRNQAGPYLFEFLAVVIETEEARGSPRKEEKSKVLFRTCPNQMDCLYEGRDHENGGARYLITWKLGTPWPGR
jgi:hypothetical protein